MYLFQVQFKYINLFLVIINNILSTSLHYCKQLCIIVLIEFSILLIMYIVVCGPILWHIGNMDTQLWEMVKIINNKNKYILYYIFNIQALDI